MGMWGMCRVNLVPKQVFSVWIKLHLVLQWGARGGVKQMSLLRSNSFMCSTRLWICLYNAINMHIYVSGSDWISQCRTRLKPTLRHKQFLLPVFFYFYFFVVITRIRPPRWSSGQRVWLLTMRLRVRSPVCLPWGGFKPQIYLLLLGWFGSE